MVMISKETGDPGSFYLNLWDMQQFQEGLRAVYFTTSELNEQADHVATVVEDHLAKLPLAQHNFDTPPTVEPRFEAKYASVVMEALRYNLYAKLPPLSGPEVPVGYKGMAAQTGRALRKLAWLANNSV